MFNLVTAVESYYVWPDIINDLKEILRVIKPGGRLVLVNETYKHEDFERRNSRISNLLNSLFVGYYFRLRLNIHMRTALQIS